MKVEINGREIRRMPIFIPELRNAWREGRKKMTRRLFKGPVKDPHYGGWIAAHEMNSVLRDTPEICPYGQPGAIRVMPEPLIRDADGYARYKDDGAEVKSILTGKPLPWRWKSNELSSLLMPTEAGRLFRKLAEVRVERLQDISVADAVREGTGSGIADFRNVWDSINADRCPWSSNPWLWVLRYEPVDPCGVEV
jgi:hypothetical protein